MAAKKAKPRENLTEQLVVRVKPSTRVRLEKLAEAHQLRGVGEAVRRVLEVGWV
jgi:hypothetical protein